MNFRDWLIIIGLIVIVGLIIDALRRLWFQRRLKTQITFGLQTVKGADDNYASELPNGGARLKTDCNSVSDDSFDDGTKPSNQKKENGKRSGRIAPVFSSSDELLGSKKGIDSESTHQNYDVSDIGIATPKEYVAHQSASPQLEPTLHSINGPVALQLAPASEPIVSVKGKQHSENDEVMLQVSSEAPISDMDSEENHVAESYEIDNQSNVLNARPVTQPLSYESADASSIKTLDNDASVKDKVISEPAQLESGLIESNPVPVKELTDYCAENNIKTLQPLPKEMLIFHLEAKKGAVFSGDDVLQVLLDNGLRLGDMNVFHCIRSGIRQSKDVMFSVANGMEPGSFDLKTMRKDTFTILTFFMGLPGPEAPIEAFNAMLDTVDIVSRHLYAEVKDEQHCKMTLQMLEYYREKVAEYQRLQMLDHQTG